MVVAGLGKELCPRRHGNHALVFFQPSRERPGVRNALVQRVGLPVRVVSGRIDFHREVPIIDQVIHRQPVKAVVQGVQGDKESDADHHRDCRDQGTPPVPEDVSKSYPENGIHAASFRSSWTSPSWRTITRRACFCTMASCVEKMNVVRRSRFMFSMRDMTSSAV